MICPSCGNSDPARHLGHELQGVYDGVLVWQCLVCGHARSRGHAMPRRERAAIRYANMINSGEDGPSGRVFP